MESPVLAGSKLTVQVYRFNSPSHHLFVTNLLAMETHTHTTYWKEYHTRWKAAMEHHHHQLADLIAIQDLGRIQLHATALRLIAENDFEQYRTFCEEAEHPLNPVESWQIEWQD